MVLSPDLVRARRRGEVLHVSEFQAGERPLVEQLGALMLEAAQQCVDQSFEDVEVALGQVVRPTKYEKVWGGFKKIILDESVFSDIDGDDPISLRKALFERAAQSRMGLADEQLFDRETILHEVAAQLEMSKDSLEDALFCDLKGAKRLKQAPALSPEQLVETYEYQHVQGVLLRAVRLVAHVKCADPDEFRRLFRKLKFRQLMFRLSEEEGGRYRIEIDGPFSIFEAVTKYGMQFALVLPALMECESGSLDADLRWGKERRPLTYHKAWKRVASDFRAGVQELSLRPEVETLLSALEKKKTAWTAEPWGELLHIPGVGLCVSDLKFSAPGRPTVYLEVMGFWSREAVWQRVEWAQSGQHERVIFAVSSRLRVSEEVLPADCGASLYVFKGSMSATAVLKQVEALAGLAG